jgi:hypothetical protein
MARNPRWGQSAVIVGHRASAPAAIIARRVRATNGSMVLVAELVALRPQPPSQAAHAALIGEADRSDLGDLAGSQ